MILDLTTIPIRKAIGLMRHLASVACIVLLASLAQAQTSKKTPPEIVSRTGTRALCAHEVS